MVDFFVDWLPQECEAWGSEAGDAGTVQRHQSEVEYCLTNNDCNTPSI